MAENLEIVILGTDKASGVFQSVGNSMNGLFKTGAVIATAGFVALAGGIGLALSKAMEAEAIQAELNAVLKSTGGIAGVTADEANSLATALSNVTKFSDDAIVSGESMLLTFTNIGSDVFPQATEAMLNLGEKFGSVDQASIQLGKALNDPIEGVGAPSPMAGCSAWWMYPAMNAL